MSEKKFGLLGEKLSHSFSPQIHKEFGNYEYLLYEIKKSELDKFFSDKKLSGFNITIPYKQIAMKYCYKIDEKAEKIGSINTVIRDGNGKLIGYNTDYDGFLYMLNKKNINLKNKKVAILGTGGASLTAETVAKTQGASEIIKISRNGSITYKDKDKYLDSEIIINCTPVGMYPNNLDKNLNLREFKKIEGVVDCIYNPRRSALLLQAESLGIKNIDGLPMLLAQGKKAAEYFQNKKIEDSILEESLKNLRGQFENIILIGMPGSGKTSIAKKLSKKMNMPYYDTDQEIEKIHNINISEYIQNSGEKKFRKLESEIIKILGKKTGVIIATGGGVVLNENNYNPLKQNGTIFFIERKIESLSTRNRPLSKGGISTLEKMYKNRKPKYEKFADFKVENVLFKNTISKIEEMYNENLSN